MTFAKPASPRLGPATPSPEPAHTMDDTAGDPVCWLDKVCPTCGLLTGTDDPACPRCGDVIPH